MFLSEYHFTAVWQSKALPQIKIIIGITALDRCMNCVVRQVKEKGGLSRSAPLVVPERSYTFMFPHFRATRANATRAMIAATPMQAKGIHT